jgi:hypothetical protein
METKLYTAEEATELALKFVKRHRSYARLLKATKEGDTWHVRMDIGLIATKIATINIDAKNGQIIDYDLPG